MARYIFKFKRMKYVHESEAFKSLYLPFSQPPGCSGGLPLGPQWNVPLLPFPFLSLDAFIPEKAGPQSVEFHKCKQPPNKRS